MFEKINIPLAYRENITTFAAIMTDDNGLPKRKRMRLLGYDYSLPGDYFVTIVTQGRTCRFGEVVDGQMRLNDAGRMVEACYKELADGRDGIECLDYAVMPNHLHCIIRLLPTEQYSALPRREFACQIPNGGNAEFDKQIPYGVPNGGNAEFDKQIPYGVPNGGNTEFDKQIPYGVPNCGNTEFDKQIPYGVPNGGNAEFDKQIPYGVPIPEIIRRLKSKTTVAYIHGVRDEGWPPFDRQLWQKGYYDHIIRRERVFDYIRNYIFLNPERWYYDKMNPQCCATPDDINQGIKNLY